MKDAYRRGGLFSKLKMYKASRHFSGIHLLCACACVRSFVAIYADARVLSGWSALTIAENLADDLDNILNISEAECRGQQIENGAGHTHGTKNKDEKNNRARQQKRTPKTVRSIDRVREKYKRRNRSISR